MPANDPLDMTDPINRPRPWHHLTCTCKMLAPSDGHKVGCVRGDAIRADLLSRMQDHTDQGEQDA